MLVVRLTGCAVQPTLRVCVALQRRTRAYYLICLMGRARVILSNSFITVFAQSFLTITFLLAFVNIRQRERRHPVIWVQKHQWHVGRAQLRVSLMKRGMDSDGHWLLPGFLTWNSAAIPWIGRGAVAGGKRSAPSIYEEGVRALEYPYALWGHGA